MVVRGHVKEGQKEWDLLVKCTLTTLREGASLQNKQTVSTFVTKTEYTYIQQMYLKLFGKSFLFTKKVNWKKYSYPLFYLL